MNISKKHLSTGKLAEMFSVCPDTVLRWARGGKISAIRTPGGYCRIKHKQLA